MRPVRLAPLVLIAALLACSPAAVEETESAAAALARQDYPAARDAAQAALRERPEDAQTLALLARIHLAMGNGIEADGALRRLAQTGELPANFTLMQAEARLQQGDTAEALRLAGTGSDAGAVRIVALAHAASGDAEQAAAAFARSDAATGDPVDRARLYAAKASFHLDRGETEAARLAVAAAQRLAPERIETLFVTGRLAELQGQHEIASRAFLAILDAAPLDRPAMLGAAAALGALERYDLIRPLVERGRDAYPGDLDFLYLEARLAAQDGQWQAVRDLLQQHEPTLRLRPEMRGLYGEALLELGRTELARTHLAAAYRADPSVQAAAEAYARLLTATGEGAEAARVLAPFAAAPVN